MNSYKELKYLALQGKNMQRSKILNSYFRLWYNPNNDYIELIYRFKSISMVITKPTGITTFNISNQDITPYIYRVCNWLYGVKFSLIKTPARISYFNKFYITDKNGAKYVYVQNEIDTNQKTIVYAGKYANYIINKTWSNEYTQTSKKNRAAFTALNNMIPMDNKEKTKLQYFTSGNYTQDIVDLVLNTPKPTAEEVYKLRKYLQLRYVTNIRPVLQNILNGQRYAQAEKANKTSTVYQTNSAR